MEHGDVAYLAYHDALTGLANRVALLEGLEGAIERATTDSRAIALLYVDLDDFKLINDGLGHGTGDEVLQAVARRLEGLVRESDVLARHGGDEFLIILGDLPAEGASREHAERRAISVCERIEAALAEPLVLAGADLHLRASVGMSLFPFDAADAATLLRHADSAMYEAKAQGGGHAVYRRGTSNPLAHLSLAGRLRHAIAEGELIVHYQPIFRLDERQAIGVEALVRWQQPDGTLIAPDAFIPVAERTGLISALGAEVARQICERLVAWEAEGLAPRVGLNVSPRELRRPGFAASLVACVREHGIDPARIIVELTESTWTLDAVRTLPVLDELRANGLRLALDDFGAGYSSLARLRDLPVDVIKVDRAFLQGVPGEDQATAIIRAIVELARACECDVVVEGIEDDEQLAFLRDVGVRLGQGYLLAKPGPADQVAAFLQGRLAPDRRA